MSTLKYTDRLNVSLTTGKSQGGTFFDRQCPNGSVISKLHGHIVDNGRRVSAIKGVCTDGTVLDPIGQDFKTTTEFGPVINGPVNWIISRQDNRDADETYLTALQSGNNALGTGWDDQTWMDNKCPDGTYMAGYFGRAGENIDNITFSCGYKKEDYCGGIDLEHPMCQGISKTVLDKACSRIMTPTCFKRKDELDENVFKNFCVYFPNEPVCSCYKPKPQFILDAEAKLREGNSPNQVIYDKCWNAECLASGRLRDNERNATCPSVKICRQVVNMGGNSNMVSADIQQDCSDNPKPKPDEEPKPLNNLGPNSESTLNTNTGTNTKNIRTTDQDIDLSAKKPFFKSNAFYLFLLVIFVVIIGYAAYDYDHDETETIYVVNP